MKKNMITIVALFLMGMMAQAEQPPVADNPLSLAVTRSMEERLFERSEHLKEALVEKGMPRYIEEDTYPVHSADTVMIYTWDSNTQKFEIWIRELFSYEQDKASEILREIPGDEGFKPAEKETLTYHPSGKVHERIIQIWHNDAWLNMLREVYLYDQHENFILETHGQWSSSDGDWEDYFGFMVNYEYVTDDVVSLAEAYFWSLFLEDDIWHPAYREEYTYDDLDRLTEMVWSTPFSGDFMLSQMEAYFYDGDSPSIDHVIVYNYHDTWVAEYKVTDLVWYDEALGLPTSYLIWTTDDWDDDFKLHNEVEWFPMQRTTYSYHPTLHEPTEVLVEIFFGEFWFPYFRMTTTYNEYNCKVRYEEQYNVSFDGEEWMTDEGYWFEGSFDAEGQPLNLTLRLYDWWEEEWQEEKQFVFGYASDDPPTSVSRSGETQQQLAHIFPNPANDLLRISFVQDCQDASVAILNMGGQKVRQISAAGVTGELTIDVSNLPQGVYLLRVQCGNFLQTEKVRLVR